MGHRAGTPEPEALETYLAAVSPCRAPSFQSTGSRPALSAPAASPLSDEERFVCAQLGLSEAEYLAVRG
ncbi:MAG: phage protease [Bilophila wadsworthia]